MYQYSDEKELVHDLLWHRDDVKIVGPAEVIEAVKSSLDSIKARHG